MILKRLNEGEFNFSLNFIVQNYCKYNQKISPQV